MKVGLEISASLSKRKQAARRAYMESIAAGAPPTQTKIHGEPAGAVRTALGWERSVPRCENCRYVRKAQTLIHKSTAALPVVLVPPVCERGRFYTREASLCDFWQGQNGDVLEGEKG